MNTDLPPETIFSGFKIATMANASTAFVCGFSGKPIYRSVIDGEYGLLENVSIGVRNGTISWLALEEEIPTHEPSLVQRVDGQGALLTPGLIDCHTHLVYGGNRAVEWEMRLSGKTYEEIALSGGGILSSVRATRAASEQELFDSAANRLRYLMMEGVTTIEIKSGYGLDVENELKILRVARQLEQHFPISVETTLLGAHAIPPEFKGNADGYVRLVCESMIPQARDLCSSVDAFCESIAFDLEQTRHVFEASAKAGLQIKVHAEQLTHTGAAAMAAEMDAVSADHLEFLSESDCEIMRHHGTVATLLPGAFYCLKEKQKPPVNALRKNGVPIAIATDSNPGSSPVLSLLLMGNMACNLFEMTPAESLAGMTRNGAMALRLQQEIGTIEIGKRADFAAWNVNSPAELFYSIGHNPCVGVFKAGKETRF